ncbi:MAG: cysteine hydrolase family protein, partial [bacterium]
MSNFRLVLIDIQRDFYHPEGSYGRAGRPLEPIQQTISHLKNVVDPKTPVIRVQSVYKPGQFEDMPHLCKDPDDGGRWHPDLTMGDLLTKEDHSGFPALKRYFTSKVPLILAGVCTHRCVQATLRDLVENGWNVSVYRHGVSSCGLRHEQHEQCLRKWDRRGLLLSQ